MTSHSYEELRSAALDVLSGRQTFLYEPNQYENLIQAVGELFARRQGQAIGKPNPRTHRLASQDTDLLLEVFWDLFRQGIISLGKDDSNRQFPFFRLTRLGQRLVHEQEAYFFHDVSSYEAAIRSEVPQTDEVTLLYLKEAMQAFHAGCLLSATVMVGVATEHAFQLLLEQLESHPVHSATFASAIKQRTLLKQFNTFSRQLESKASTLPSHVKEDLATHLQGVLSTIRMHRNEAGHPTGKILSREHVFVLLQLFITYNRKLHQLRDHFQ